MKKIFTNGCFDILHIGHINLLKYSKSLGDYLIVGLNSDKSIKKIKGNNRPIICENERKLMLESIRWVDEVVIFEEENPLQLIKKIKPNIIVKGGDYTKEQVIGYGLAEIIIFDYINGHSTTKIIENISSR